MTRRTSEELSLRLLLHIRLTFASWRYWLSQYHLAWSSGHDLHHGKATSRPIERHSMEFGLASWTGWATGLHHQFGLVPVLTQLLFRLCTITIEHTFCSNTKNSPFTCHILIHCSAYRRRSCCMKHSERLRGGHMHYASPSQHLS